MAKFSNVIKIGSIVMATYEFYKMLAFCQEALHYIPDVIVWITKKKKYLFPISCYELLLILISCPNCCILFQGKYLWLQLSLLFCSLFSTLLSSHYKQQ